LEPAFGRNWKISITGERAIFGIHPLAVMPVAADVGKGPDGGSAIADQLACRQHISTGGELLAPFCFETPQILQ
jgi:hypothetical protein